MLGRDGGERVFPPLGDGVLKKKQPHILVVLPHQEEHVPRSILFIHLYL